MDGVPKIFRFEPVYETGRPAGLWLVESLGRTGASPAWASLEFSTDRRSGCRVAEGPLAGRGFAGLVMDLGDDLLGGEAMMLIDNGLALSAKFMASNQGATDAIMAHLSEHGGWRRTMPIEAVVVLEASQGSSIYCGRREGLSEEQFRSMLHKGTGAFTEHPVEAGDVFVVPGGMLYALGRGVMAYAAAIEAVGADTGPGGVLSDPAAGSRLFINSLGYIDGQNAITYLYAAGGLCTMRLDLRGEWTDDRDGDGPRPSFIVFSGIEGQALLIADEETETLERGRTLFVSASCRRVRLNPGPEGAMVLKTWVADFKSEVEAPLAARGMSRDEIDGLRGMWEWYKTTDEHR